MAENDDFIFLDPPYDCVFNDYGNIDMMNGFDETEHRRLAADFRNLPCRTLMIIGKTPLTEELYGNYIFDEYYKNFLSNFYAIALGGVVQSWLETSSAARMSSKELIHMLRLTVTGNVEAALIRAANEKK